MNLFICLSVFYIKCFPFCRVQLSAACTGNFHLAHRERERDTHREREGEGGMEGYGTGAHSMHVCDCLVCGARERAGGWGINVDTYLSIFVR